MTMKNKNKLNIKKKLAIAIIFSTIVIVMVGFSVAFLTGTDKVTNVFSSGGIKINLTESKYTGNASDAVKNLAPNGEVPKNPAVSNVGTNDVYVFVKISVPVKNVTMVGDDGTKDGSGKKNQEIFYFKQNTDSLKLHENNFRLSSDGFVELTEVEEGTDMKGKERTYIFGYTKKIKNGDVTPELFDKIQLKNILENEIDSSLAQNIEITANTIISIILVIAMVIPCIDMKVFSEDAKKEYSNSLNGWQVSARWNNDSEDYSITADEDSVIRPKLTISYYTGSSDKTYKPGEIEFKIPGIGGIKRGGVLSALTSEGKEDFAWNVSYDSENDVYTF